MTFPAVSGLSSLGGGFYHALSHSPLALEIKSKICFAFSLSVKQSLLFIQIVLYVVPEAPGVDSTTHLGCVCLVGNRIVQH